MNQANPKEEVNNNKPEENVFESYHDSTRSFQFVKREANSIFAVPNESQSEMIAKKIKEPQPVQGFVVPSVRGPSSFTNNFGRLKDQKGKRECKPSIFRSKLRTAAASIYK